MANNYYGKPRAYVAFQVRLTPELKEKLMKWSFETGQSQVAIINAALEHYFAHVATENPQAAPDVKEGDGPS